MDHTRRQRTTFADGVRVRPAPGGLLSSGTSIGVIDDTVSQILSNTYGFRPDPAGSPPTSASAAYAPGSYSFQQLNSCQPESSCYDFWLACRATGWQVQFGLTFLCHAVGYRSFTPRLHSCFVAGMQTAKQRGAVSVVAVACAGGDGGSSFRSFEGVSRSPGQTRSDGRISQRQ